MQRFFDLLFVLAALVLLLPLLLLIMVALRFSGEGEVFFRQSRIGLRGTPFGLLKFATMLKDSPSIGTGTITLKNDPRVLPLGGFLRKTKINELPQLLNVLKGDMSLIGPRPQTARCFAAFPESSQSAIATVRPGLSGLGSIVFRDEEDLLDQSVNPDEFYDEVIMPYKGLLEEWYVENAGLRMYFSCLVATVVAVLLPASSSIMSLFPGLPAPPAALQQSLPETVK